MGTDSAASRRAIRLAERFDDDRQLRERVVYLARLVAEGKASDRACRESLANLVKDWPDTRFRAWTDRDIAEEARHQLMKAIMSPSAFDWERCAAGIVAWIATINRRTAYRMYERRRIDERHIRTDLQWRWDGRQNANDRRESGWATPDVADQVVARVQSEFDLTQALGPTALLDERCAAFCELFELPAPTQPTHAQSRAARQLLRAHRSAKSLMRRFLAGELPDTVVEDLFAVFADHDVTVWERVAKITLHLDDAYADAAWRFLTYPNRETAVAS